MKSRFQLIGVSKSYRISKKCSGINPVIALSNIHLNIPEQGVTAMVGTSGSGKSSLARILARLEPFDSGDFFYKGVDYRLTGEKDFRLKNQIMFQNPLLSVNPFYTIFSILAEPLIINKVVKKSEINERIQAFLDRFELPLSILKKYPSELSGGELQRIVLARAMILEPEFLILDEPLSALDEIMAFRVLGFFKQIFKQFNIGIFYISHNQNHVKFLADYIYYLEGGHIQNCCTIYA